MRAAAVRLTPLTSEEQLFSEEHHELILRFLKYQKLNPDEYYGVAVMGYLRAVKKWFARPELHLHKFEAIAWMNMRCDVGNEHRKQRKCIKTVSLDAVIPGTDNLTLANTITYSNLNYLGKAEGEEAMKMSYDVAIPVAAKMKGSSNVEVENLLEFLESSHKTMMFEYPDKKAAISKKSSLRSWRKNHNRTDFEVYRLDACVYIEKIKVKKADKEESKCQ